MPDAYCGEWPMAYIAYKEGESATGEALIAYCKEHFATFKVPCLISFRDELPKLPTGKVLGPPGRGTTTCACAGESSCKIRSLKQRDGKD